MPQRDSSFLEGIYLVINRHVGSCRCICQNYSRDSCEGGHISSLTKRLGPKPWGSLVGCWRDARARELNKREVSFVPSVLTGFQYPLLVTQGEFGSFFSAIFINLPNIASQRNVKSVPYGWPLILWQNLKKWLVFSLILCIFRTFLAQNLAQLSIFFQSIKPWKLMQKTGSMQFAMTLNAGIKCEARDFGYKTEDWRVRESWAL